MLLKMDLEIEVRSMFETVGISWRGLQSWPPASSDWLMQYWMRALTSASHGSTDSFVYGTGKQVRLR